MADIFISYAREDRGKVEKLAAALEDEGNSVWWDRQLVGGAEFSEEIERELEAARTIIVCWSETGSKSRWVKDEASIAADNGKLITVSIDGAGPPIGYRQFHCLDLAGWQGAAEEAAFKDVSRAVKARLNGETPTPDTEPRRSTPSGNSLSNLIADLQRRSVFKVAVVYAVVGWVVMQVVSVMSPALELPGWVDGFFAVTLIAGFPIALILAWAFEMTPKGIRRTASVEGDKATTTILAGLTLVAIVGALSLLFLRGGPDASVDEGSQAEDVAAARAPDDKSIAVLPFTSMSTLQDDEFFADGLSEELLNVLTNIEALKVAARTSSFYFKGKNEDLRVIGEKLGVNHVLEGSVRRSGDQLRITAQLISVDDGYHLWSETYDRTMSDIFEVQDDISHKVAGALKVTLLGEEGAPAMEEPDVNPEARRLFLIAQAKLSQRGLENLRSARQLFQQAIDLDPNYARAHVGYANATLLLDSNHKDLPSSEALTEAKRAAGIAVNLDPKDSDVYATFGQIASNEALSSGDPADMQNAIENFEQALSLNPRNVQAIYWYAIVLETIGDTEQALSMFERALSIDPLARVAHYRKAVLLTQLGHLDEAEDQLLDALALFPDYLSTQAALSDLEMQRGRLDRAVYWMTHAHQSDPNSFIYKMQAALRLAELGETDAALKVVEIPPDDSSFAANYLRGMRFTILGDYAALYEVALKFGDQGNQGWAAAAPTAAMINGDFEIAQQLFMTAYPKLYADDIVFTPGGLNPESALAPAFVEKRLGDEARARNIVTAAIAGVEAHPAKLTGYRLHGFMSLAHVVLGDNEAALAELKAAYDTGYRGGWVMGVGPPDIYPLLEDLRSEPEFQAIAKQIAEDVEAQRRNWTSGETTREVEAELEARGLSF